MQTRYTSSDVKELFLTFYVMVKRQKKIMQNPPDLAKGMDAMYIFYYWVAMLQKDFFWYRVRIALDRASVQELTTKHQRNAQQEYQVIVANFEKTFSYLGDISGILLAKTAGLLPELKVEDFAKRQYEEGVESVLSEIAGTENPIQYDYGSLVSPEDIRVKEYAQIVQKTRSMISDFEPSLAVLKEHYFDRYFFDDFEEIEVPINYQIASRVGVHEN